jgi:D-alanine-D-alanine ligase
MKIGITYDLKSEPPAGSDLPDDAQEEFDSPATIEGIAAVLRGLGHDVRLLGDGRQLLEKLLGEPPDFVFNIAEGQGVGRSREARVPAVLEMLGIPYTGSDPLTLAVTLDKDCAKRLVASEGVAVPRGRVLTPGEDLEAALADWPRGPSIVKPAWEGSSKGIRGKCLAETPDALREAVFSLWDDHRQPVLLEEYVEGEEITVGLVGNDPPQVIGILRVLPLRPNGRFIYSLEVKRDWQRQVRYECPPRLPATDLRAVEEAARKVHRVLGCRDVARVDFRLHRGVPYFLEVNPLPGLNAESSDLVILAKHAGWTYPRLIEAVLRAARERHRNGAWEGRISELHRAGHPA